MDPVVHLRNHTLGAVHERTCYLYSRIIPRYLRTPIEFCLLASALTMMFVWMYVHLAFFKSAGNCFQELDIPEGPPLSQIVSIQMFWNSTETWAMLQKMKTTPSRKRPYFVLDVGEPHGGESGTREPHGGESGTREPHGGESGTAECREGVPNTDISPDSTTQVTTQSDVSEKATIYGVNSTIPVEGFEQCNKVDISRRERLVSPFNKYVTPKENSHVSGSTGAGSVLEKFEEKRNEKNKRSKDSDQSTLRVETNLLDEVGQNRLLYALPEYMLMEFSQQPGYLSLSKLDRYKFNITNKMYTVDLNNVTCFGGTFGQFLHYYLLGFETTLINSFTYIMDNSSQKAYVRNALTGEYYHLKVMWLGRTRYILALMPLLFFTMIASALFRQSQYQIFKLIFVFRHVAMHEELPFAMSAIGHMPLLTMTYACVGLMVVMSEVLTDSGLFCMFMLFTVWISDQYYAIFCNSDTSKKYWPRFFFLYHFIPYAFYVRMNGIFWMLPFVVHWCLLQHSMLHFFHHYELPRYEDRNDWEEPLFQGVNDFGIHIVTFFRHMPAVGWLEHILHNGGLGDGGHRDEGLGDGGHRDEGLGDGGHRDEGLEDLDHRDEGLRDREFGGGGQREERPLPGNYDNLENEEESLAVTTQDVETSSLNEHGIGHSDRNLSVIEGSDNIQFGSNSHPPQESPTSNPNPAASRHSTLARSPLYHLSH